MLPESPFFAKETQPVLPQILLYLLMKNSLCSPKSNLFHGRKNIEKQHIMLPKILCFHSDSSLCFPKSYLLIGNTTYPSPDPMFSIGKIAYRSLNPMFCSHEKTACSCLKSCFVIGKTTKNPQTPFCHRKNSQAVIPKSHLFT